MSAQVQLIECPRDAMQGWKEWIPTEKKIQYINALLKVGFHTIDFGSFVSPKAIPQMADTAEVLKGLDLSSTSSKLLAIIANERGAEDAAQYDSIHYLGFPFSISETFQQRNTNSSIQDALVRVEKIQEICSRSKKEFVVYLSMGFGNPYGDPWSEEIVFHWANELVKRGIVILSLADTVGVAAPEQVSKMTKYLIDALPYNTIGVHLHSSASNRAQKLDAAYQSGCRRFDGALKGIGGCPMAKDELVGNMDTEWMMQFLKAKESALRFNESALSHALMLASEIFG
ncbi:MAG: hydroxymethylglutaryl-CoA lyase [Bacteroidetes bacterium]|nr:hydroxymethylglutaryl-CoA lyase [Bacteroidota bacterium]